MKPFVPFDAWSYSLLLGFYFFSHRSADIRGLFCEYCDKLGIRWTQSNARNISVSHRDSVARLDAFVGPKS